MRGKPLYKERYPGLQPFGKGQSTIFFGRDQETRELFYQICLEKIVVLFGKSGLGKSSLLNAGVSPLLEEKGYLPLTVRFSPPKKIENDNSSESDPNDENLLIRDFIIAFKGFYYKKKILFNRENPQLWEYIKATSFTGEIVEKENTPLLWDYIQRKKEIEKSETPVPVIPVFIFDQFEQFFYHPVRHQQEFLVQLAEVVHDETPYRILEWITGIDSEERTPAQIEWHQPPVVKVIFALRSDKLANMQSIVPFIPTMLRNRYELKPLTNAQASEAIRQPAQKELGSEYASPFSFDPGTLDNIVKELSKGSNEIESSQLQIICNHIENKLRVAMADNPGKVPAEINQSIINPPEDFPKILDNFYYSQLDLIEDEVDRDKARILIEDELVIDGQRDSISERKLLNTLGIKKELIEELKNTRLIREENTNRGAIYELSHDTLVAPVEKSKRKRLRSEENKKIEEERMAFEIASKKKDEELKARYSQLAKEIQLREEAELQKAEVEKLSQKLKKKGALVFFLTFALFIAACFFLVRFIKQSNYNFRQREISEKNEKKSVLIAKKYKDSLITTIDSLQETKALQIKVLKNADSINRLYKIDNFEIVKIIDSVYRSDTALWKLNPNRLTPQEKLELIDKKHFDYYKNVNKSVSTEKKYTTQ